MELKNISNIFADSSQFLDSIQEECSDDIISSKKNKLLKRYELID
jgi:hypothetical protein